MKYAICNETFQGWEWEQTCATVAELGFDAVEIAPFTLADDVRYLEAGRRREIARIAKGAGLDVVGLHWLLVSPKGLSLTTADAEVRTATSEYLAALMDFCADIGGRVLVLGSPAQRRVPPGDSAAQAADRLQRALVPALERAALHGLTLCIEPLPPPEADLILTLQEAMEIVRIGRNPALKTILDVKSAASECRPLPELIHEFGPWIGHVHANDTNRRGPGSGETDFVPILRALHEIGYSGTVSIEVFDYAPDPVTIAREGLATLKRCEAAARGPA